MVPVTNDCRTKSLVAVNHSQEHIMSNITVTEPAPTITVHTTVPETMTWDDGHWGIYHRHACTICGEGSDWTSSRMKAARWGRNHSRAATRDGHEQENITAGTLWRMFTTGEINA
jgi:hypothetical protein